MYESVNFAHFVRPQLVGQTEHSTENASRLLVWHWPANVCSSERAKGTPRLWTFLSRFESVRPISFRAINFSVTNFKVNSLVTFEFKSSERSAACVLCVCVWQWLRIDTPFAFVLSLSSHNFNYFFYLLLCNAESKFQEQQQHTYINERIHTFFKRKKNKAIATFTFESPIHFFLFVFRRCCFQLNEVICAYVNDFNNTRVPRIQKKAKRIEKPATKTESWPPTSRCWHCACLFLTRKN